MAQREDGGYPLALLLKVRQHREEDARRAEESARRATKEAAKAHEAAQLRVADYRTWRIEEEARRYAAVLGRELEKRDLDRFRAGLSALTAEEARLEEAVTQAASAVDICRAEEANASAQLRQAVKDCARIQEHRDLWREEDHRHQEHREEQELET